VSTIPLIPTIATDDNYDSGAYPWSGQPTKVALTSGYKAKGWIPGTNVAAEHENYFKHGLSVGLSDAQLRAAVKSNMGGFVGRNCGAHFAWLPRSKALVGTETISSAYKLVSRSSDLAFKRDTTSDTNGLEICQAVYNPPSGTGYLVYFPWGIAGGAANAKRVQDFQGLGVASITPPNSNARYHDGCMDEATGNAVMLSGGGGTGGTAYGWAYGDPSGSMSFATFSGWTADELSTVASKPATDGYAAEVRAFSLAKSAYSTNGGGTIASVDDNTWNGATDPNTLTNPFMSRPTWDGANLRWVCATSSMYDYSTEVSKLWVSTDGYSWEYLAAANLEVGGWLITTVHYHAGWLWAIAFPNGALERHPGLHILVSKDGGATWIETEVSLSMSPIYELVPEGQTPNTYVSRDLLRHNRITSCGSFLLFQTTLEATVWTGAETTAYRVIHTG